MPQPKVTIEITADGWVTHIDGVRSKRLTNEWKRTEHGFTSKPTLDVLMKNDAELYDALDCQHFSDIARALDLY